MTLYHDWYPLFDSYVDAKLKTTKRFRYKRIIERFPAYENKLKFWDPDLCASQPKLFHFIITVS